MNAVIGALRVVLGLDSAAFETGLDQSQRRAAAFGNAMKTAFAVVATAAAAAGVAVGAALKGAINEADDLSKSASKIGIPIEELSKLAYAADLSDLSLEGLTAGVKKLSSSMAGVLAGDKSATQLFSGIGVSATDAQGKLKSTTQVLGELSDKFASMKDGAEKTALAVKIFGKSGLDMIPLLNGGSAALQEATAEAAAFGLEVSAATGKAAEQFNDNLSRIGYAASSLSTQLAAALAPGLAGISDVIVEVVKNAGSLISYLPTLGKVATVAGAGLAAAFGPTIIATLRTLVIAIGTNLVGALNMVTAAVARNPLGALAVVITTVVTAMYQFRDSAAAANAELAAQAAPASQIAGMIGDLKRAQDAYTSAIAQTASGQASATSTIIANTKKEFEAKKSLLELELKRQQAAVSVQKAELAQAGNALKAAVGQSVFTNMNTDAQGFSDPKVGRLVNLPDDVTGLDKTRDILNSNGLSDKITELRANIDLTELSTSQLQDALKSTFSDATATAAEAGTAAVAAGGKIGGAAKAATDPWDGLRNATDSVKKSIGSASEAGQSFAETLGDAFKGLVTGTMTIKEAIRGVIGQLASMWAEKGAQALFGGGVAGKSGGLFGSLLGGIGSLFGFANGGEFKVGGAGGVDSQLVAFKASPNETVSVTKPGQEASSARSLHVTFAADISKSGNLLPFVTDVADQRMGAAAPAIVSRANQSAPMAVAQHQVQKMGGDYRG
jgi:hypothetical protein